MYIVQSATTPAFISGCGTYLILKVSKTRVYTNFFYFSICDNHCHLHLNNFSDHFQVPPFFSEPIII